MTKLENQVNTRVSGKKSREYGYYLGKQFLCTFESTDHMLDMNHFERMIRERFQCP